MTHIKRKPLPCHSEPQRRIRPSPLSPLPPPFAPPSHPVPLIAPGDETFDRAEVPGVLEAEDEVGDPGVREGVEGGFVVAIVALDVGAALDLRRIAADLAATLVEDEVFGGNN